MGWQFELRDANIVAYLTRSASEDEEPPRIKGEDLVRFLGGISQGSQALISGDPTWIEKVSRTARESGGRLDSRLRGEDWRAFASPSVIKDSLADLRRIFESFDLYALVATGDQWGHDWTDAFFRHAAYASDHGALVLTPRGGMGRESLDYFDPLPPVQLIANHPENFPGVLFWLRTGESTFAPIRDAGFLFHELAEHLDSGLELSTIINKYNNERSSVQRSRILHLSDLHFGSHEALDNEPYLETCLLGKRNEFDRIVITGDLFDNPKQSDYRAFHRFLTSLKNWNPKDPVLVPGNHDQRTFGNNLGRIGQEYRLLANIKWGPGVLIDDDLHCVFLCFNSSEQGDWARGKISDSQLKHVATELQVELSRRPELDDYERIAVIHHHPFPYAPEELPVQKGRKRLFRGNERFIQMEESDRFLAWCAARQTPLILHGHKHIARHRSDVINTVRGSQQEITAVGCGTSLGIGNRPLSYNIVSWVPGAERWSASFFSDPGDGSGFHQDYITLYRSREVA